MTRSEIDRHRNVVLLGSGTADRLFENLDPIDRRIKIQGIPFRVVGVSRPKGSTFGRSNEFQNIHLKISPLKKKKGEKKKWVFRRHGGGM